MTWFLTSIDAPRSVLLAHGLVMLGGRSRVADEPAT
jgi:hypothetical protein